MNLEEIKKANDYQKAHLNLAQHALDKNFSITVRYSLYEDEGCNKSTDYKTIKEAVEAVDESYMLFYDSENVKRGWAFIVLGNNDWELVSDYSVSKWLDEWSSKFETLHEELGTN